MKKVIFLLLFLALSHSAIAGSFKAEQELRPFADKFMDQIIVSKFQEALNSAKPYWPLPAVEIDGLANQIQQQWPIVDQRFGQSIAKEFLKEERIGKSFIRYYYLQKFENHALYWRFDFYKPHKEWVINGVIYLDNLEILYE
jgi:hypothetical protein